MTRMQGIRHLALAVVLLAMPGCGEDETATPDAGPTADVAVSDAPPLVDVASDVGAEVSGDAPDVPGDVPPDVPPDGPPDVVAGHPTLAYPLEADGPFQVGHRTWEHTYTPWDGAEPRTVLLDVWYPTEDTEGDPALWSGFLPDDLAFEDATPAAPVAEDGYPVYVYSHGDRGFGGDGGNIMRRFASHGWFGVAPSHTGNTSGGNDLPTPLTHWLWRPLDVSAALDAIEDLDAADPLHGKAQTKQVLAAGHSRGIVTAWLVAGATYDPAQLATDYPGEMTDHLQAVFEAGTRESRVVASIPMAGSPRGSIFGSDGTSAVEVPMLQMTGGDDKVGFGDVWPSLSSLDIAWIEVAGACHLAFTLGACSEISDADAWHTISTYALAFGRRHVLGDTSTGVTELLDGSRKLSDLVTFERHTGD